MSAPAQPRVALAVVWMTGTLVSFAIMAVAIREVSATMSVFVILASRSLVGAVVTSVPLLWLGLGAMRTNRPVLQIARNLAHMGGQAGWIVGVTLLPLAEVFALEFTAPIWTALFATLFLGERFSRARAVAVALGFAGVLIIVQPGVAAIETGVFIMLAAAVCFAASVTMVKAMTRTETTFAIVFYMAWIQLPPGLVLAALDWTPPDLREAGWLALIGLLSISAHYCMTRAFAHADATVVMPLDFMRLPLIAAVAYLVYDEHLAIAVAVGAATIFAGNYYSVWSETRRARGGTTAGGKSG
ncbi:MAG: DMT family transporter [Alphaproteobacteria bacterium]